MCGILKGAQKSDESRIPFHSWIAASDQVELENQKLFGCVYTQINGF
jgi:hypothetical protein